MRVRTMGGQITDMYEDVKQVLKNERTEAELCKAEMQLTKATNLVRYGDEIKARPKKEWFQSQKEKRSASTLSKQVHEGSAADLRSQKGAQKKKEKVPMSTEDKAMNAAVREAKRGGRKRKNVVFNEGAGQEPAAKRQKTVGGGAFDRDLTDTRKGQVTKIIRQVRHHIYMYIYIYIYIYICILYV